MANFFVLAFVYVFFFCFPGLEGEVWLGVCASQKKKKKRNQAPAAPKPTQGWQHVEHQERSLGTFQGTWMGRSTLVVFFALVCKRLRCLSSCWGRHGFAYSNSSISNSHKKDGSHMAKSPGLFPFWMRLGTQSSKKGGRLLLLG